MDAHCRHRVLQDSRSFVHALRHSRSHAHRSVGPVAWHFRRRHCCCCQARRRTLWQATRANCRWSGFRAAFWCQCSSDARQRCARSFESCCRHCRCVVVCRFVELGDFASCGRTDLDSAPAALVARDASLWCALVARLVGCCRARRRQPRAPRVGLVAPSHCQRAARAAPPHSAHGTLPLSPPDVRACAHCGSVLAARLDRTHRPAPHHCSSTGRVHFNVSESVFLHSHKLNIMAIVVKTIHWWAAARVPQSPCASPRRRARRTACWRRARAAPPDWRSSDSAPDRRRAAP